MPDTTPWAPMPRGTIPRFSHLTAYLDHYAVVTPTAEAAVDLDGARYDYAALAERVAKLRCGLLSLGVRPGDRVATLSPPHTDAWICFLAAAGIGAIWVGLNPRYTRDEYGYVLGDAAPTVILTRAQIGERSYLEDFRALQRRGSSDAAIYLLDGSASDFSSAASLFKHSVDSTTGSRIDADQPCLLVYTSGTTGKPKGALLRQSGLVECSKVQAHHYGMAAGRVLNPLPINHVGSICDTGTTVLVTGGAQIFCEAFDPERLLPAFGSERITSWGGVPTMFQMLMAHPQFAKADMSHVRRILWSGSPMPRPVAEKLASFGVSMHNFYGMTETTGSICFTAPNAGLDELVDSIGRPELSYEVRIADTRNGRECGADEIGEIQTRAPGVLHSYLNNPEADAEAFTADGWFRTGDLATRDVSGLYHLRGRLREMYKSGGYNVYPQEIQTVLETHPEIVEAAIVSVPDPLFHEVGWAYVVLSRGSRETHETLRAYCAARLANYKLPKRFVIVDELPRLPIGKVDRTALRRLALDGDPEI